MRRKKKPSVLIELAATLASKGVDRTYRLAAVGIRADGTIVTATNGRPYTPTPEVHAEARLAQKLTPNSIVFVARILRDGSTAIARPCEHCQSRLKAAGVRQVFYTDGDGVSQMRLE